MSRLYALLKSLQADRGEFGPMAYVVMVSALVVLAVAVAAWGTDLANAFMDQADSLAP